MEIFGPNSSWFWSMLQFISFTFYLALIYYQLRQINKRNFYDITTELKKNWNSDKMLHARLNECKAKEKTIVELDEEIVLGFYENLGILRKQNIISNEIIWEYFSYNMEMYWELLKDNISNCRKNDPSLFENFTLLIDEMAKFKKKKIPISVAITSDELQRFINTELTGIPTKLKQNKRILD